MTAQSAQPFKTFQIIESDSSIQELDFIVGILAAEADQQSTLQRKARYGMEISTCFHKTLNKLNSW